MNVVLKASVKDRGSITWPPIGIDIDDETKRVDIDKLHAAIVEVAADTRKALGVVYDSTRVHVQVAFRPDITVEGL